MDLNGLVVIWDHLDYFLYGNFPGGIVLTLLMSLGAIIFATLLGIISGILLMVSQGFIRQCLIVVLAFFRAIPVIMLIFWTYFLLPVLFKVDVPAISTVIVSLSLIGGAYIGHSVHAGMKALPIEQWQAAYSLGLRKWQVIGYIILPQALRMMLPSFVNQWVSLIKDTSLAYIVGVAEFTLVSTQVNNNSMIYPTEIFSFVILVYFIICWSLNFFSNFISKHYLSINKK